jgi:hypothetical protein
MHRVVRGGLCALFAMCSLAIAPASHAAAATIPPQGVYDWCDQSKSADGCGSRLDRIGQAGFQVMLNIWAFEHPTESNLRAFADRAQQAGVKVLWPFSALEFDSADPNGNNLLSTYSGLAKSCGCSTNQGLLAYLVGLLKSFPATYGYYMADEPPQSTHDLQANYVLRVKALDPDHPRIIVGCGICNGGPDANVAWMSDIDVMLGTDAYPVVGGTPDPDYNYEAVAQNVSSLDRIATSAGRGQVVVLQSWRWGDSIWDSRAMGVDPASTRYPEQDEIQAQRDAAIQNAHPDLILWFTLTQVIGWEPGQGTSNWTNPTDTDRRWANLVGGAFSAPIAHTRRTVSSSSSSSSSSSDPDPAPEASADNRLPRARLSVLRDHRVRAAALGRRRWFVADGRSSQDPDGHIVRYVWTLNGKPLNGGTSGRRTFAVRVGKRNVLRLTVTDDSGARATARRVFRVRR